MQAKYKYHVAQPYLTCPSHHVPSCYPDDRHTGQGTEPAGRKDTTGYKANKILKKLFIRTRMNGGCEKLCNI